MTTITDYEIEKEVKSFNSTTIQLAFKELLNKPVWVASNILKNKLPINPKTGENAKANDPNTWGTFDEVLVYNQANPGHYPAIALSKELGIVAIDLDHVHERETGRTFSWASEIVKEAGSYAEYSVSGQGLHVFVKGKKPGDQCKKGQVEIYDKSKFITLTGNILLNHKEIKPAQEFLNKLYKSTFKEDLKTTEKQIEKSPRMLDEEILKLIGTAANKDRFNKLYYEGDISSYAEDDSAADLALCSMLAFYTQREDQLEQLLRKSKLNRSKWDEYRTDSTYLKKYVIEKALSNLSETYQPRKTKKTSWEDPQNIEEGDNLEIDFPLAELPEVLRKAVEEISQVNRIDPAIVALPGIGISGLQIGKKALIQEKEGLEHHPSLFLVGVMESGGRKSQGYDSMIKDIDRAIEIEEEEYKEKKAAVKANNDALQEIETQIKKDLRDKNINEKQAKEALEDLYKRKQSEPVHPCNFGDDLTPQRLFQKIAEHGGAYGVFSGEGRAILQKIVKGSQEGDTGESIYIAGMWGDRIARSRVGNNKGEIGGEDCLIRKPALTVTCFVQEDVWEELSRNKVMRQSGLISRINLVIPKSQMGTRLETPSDNPLDKTQIKPFTEAVLRIRKWNPEKTVIVKLSTEAANRRREFFNAIEKELAPNGAYEDVKDIATKAISLCARLALIFALLEQAQKGDLSQEIPPITEEQWLKAQCLQEYFLAQAIDAQRTHSKTGARHLLQKAASWLKKQSTQEPLYISASQIVKHVRGASDNLVENNIIPDLIKYGWIRNAGITRKKKPRYEVNPRVLNGNK